MPSKMSGTRTFWRAVRGRWVNQGIVQDEYRDFVRAGRPSGTSPDGHPWPDLRIGP
jgi:hypothetical protein